MARSRAPTARGSTVRARSTAVGPALAVERRARLDARAPAPTLGRRRRRRPTRRPRDRRGTRRRASSPRRPATPRPSLPVASATAWVNVGLALIPPSSRSGTTSSPVSPSAASTRSAPRWATPSSTARTTCGRPVPRVTPSSVPAGAVVPRRRAETEQGGHVHDAVGAVAAAGDVVALGARGDQAEVVTEPLDVGARRQHDRLDTPLERAAVRPGDDRDRCRARHARADCRRSRRRCTGRASRRCRT